MWLAHAMTLSRIPLAVALWAMWGDPVWSVVLLVLAGLTDTADGRIARWAKRHGRGGPDIGGWLDPAADKLFVAIVLAAIWTHTHAQAHAPVAIALIGARELVLVPLTAIYLARRAPHPPLRADRFGKLATVAQFIALCVMAVAPGSALPAAAGAGALGLVAAGHYIAVAIGDAHQGHGRTRTTSAAATPVVILHGHEATARATGARSGQHAGGREGPHDR